MKEKIKQLSEKYFTRFVELRRHIHANPELSWHETETSKLVLKTLSDLGLTVSQIQSDLGRTGVVGILKGKNPLAKCIALRADMDALPITEENQIDYCSKNKGVMHACGHDVHTSN